MWVSYLHHLRLTQSGAFYRLHSLRNNLVRPITSVDIQLGICQMLCTTRSLKNAFQFELRLTIGYDCEYEELLKRVTPIHNLHIQFSSQAYMFRIGLKWV